MNTETTNPNVSEMPADGLADPPVESVSGVQLASQVTELTAERDRLAKEKSELNDRVLRLQAEFDNFRKRSEKDRTEFAQYAGMELVREILPVLDNFELALKADCFR